jgi:hypothetical protein
MKIEHKVMTIGELYTPAMSIKTKEEAKEYLDALIEYTMAMNGVKLEDAIRIEKSNLGYYAGYYDNETIKRVQELFDCQHPIFGKVIPTAEEAFNMGRNIGRKIKGE